ncbi:MAG: ParA family protein [Myxococcaceae bacterium]|nr:ParA family protein [Myxococcaceae bacterium]
MRRIAFINEKGGTCKTTLSVNVAAWFARVKKMKVLLVDLDTQGHAGKSLGVDVRTVRPNVFDLLTDPAVALAACTRPTAVEGLFVVPSYKEMSELPAVLGQREDRARLLAGRLDAEAQDYDLVVFDAPPSMGLATFNILVAATEVVIPVGLTYLALDGCAEMVKTVEEVSAKYARPDLRVSLVVPTLYRKTALADEILAKLGEYFPDRLAKTPLGFNVKIDEAQSHGQTIWDYAPWSRGAQMLEAIAREIDAAGNARRRAVA